MLTKHRAISIVRAAVELNHVIESCVVRSLSIIGALAGRSDIILFNCVIAYRLA